MVVADSPATSFFRTVGFFDRAARSFAGTAKPFDRTGESLDLTGKSADLTGRSLDRTSRSPDHTGESADRTAGSPDRTGDGFNRAGESFDRNTFTSQHPVKPHQQNFSSLTDMAKSDYIISSDSVFAEQLQTFKTTIGGYAAILGVSPAAVTAQAADADYFNYVLACRDVMQNGGQQWNGWKTLIRNGGTPPPSGAPVVAPAFPAVVPAVAPGVEARFRALVKQIKANGNYNAAIGQALGIEGAEQTGPDLSTVKPEIEANISGNRVEIDWGWNGNSAYLDMLELEVDRNDTKGFVFLANDTTPGYIDSMAFPSTPTKWTYRAIYRVADDRVGQWSKPVSVTVGG